jgi:hypothetical protein
MIRVVGCDTGPEADAARDMRDGVLKAWPWVESDPSAMILLIPNVQCHGETPRDIDLVVLASLPIEKATFDPSVHLRLLNDNSVDADIVHVRSLCVVIEIKDHTPQDIRFVGNKVEVRYRSAGSRHQWHSVTQQNEGQKYSLRNYLARHLSGLQVPHITNLIWLRNVTRDALPRGTHNVVPATLTWTGLLNTVAANSRVWSEKKGITLAATPSESSFSLTKACELLTRHLTPTTLDRRRMDRIVNAEIREAWLEHLGRRQIIFEGRGGTGKTMILLGLAWSLQDRQHARVLLLTYNLALVADLRRLLTLMGLTDEVGAPSIEIQTVHAFIFRLLDSLGLLDRDEANFLDQYEIHKAEALNLLRHQALTESDFEEAVKAAPNSLAWDYIFVDEAQDWPQDERDILHQLYPTSRFVIADGRDQLVRRDAYCDWTRGTDRIPSKRFPLRRGLRMKANLVRFANSLAGDLDLSAWSIQLNPEAVGGRILIIEGDYGAVRTLHDEVIAAARASGNALVDLLTCIPPGMVVHDGNGRHATTADLFTSWGYTVWDGVSEDLRRNYPTSVEQLRIVQYDSCRGLEGWATINLGIDDFYDYKVATWVRPLQMDTGAVVEDIVLARRFAARWLMIPCSRAIDTLVLNIRSRTTYLGRVLQTIHDRCGDFVEWVKV